MPLSTELTFTGVGKGYTEVVVGTTIYKLTVHGANDIYLDVGESKVVVDETGYYVDADLSALDTAVATVELTGEITGYENVLSENVTAIGASAFIRCVSLSQINIPSGLTALGGDAFAAQLGGMEQLYEEITEQTLPKFYRPPQGLYSEENLRMAQKLGYQTVFWSLAYADWDNEHQPDPDAAVEKLNSRIHDGAVILLHATSKTNAEILDELLTKWKELGYRFESIEKLF